MDTFTKTTVGFVAQIFKKTAGDRFVCTRQEFVAGDRCDYEDAQGNSIEPPDYEYQPYHMRQGNEAMGAAIPNRAREAIEEVLESLDVGGEQSRQFAEEIRILRGGVGHPGPAKDSSDASHRCGR